MTDADATDRYKDQMNSEHRRIVDELCKGRVTPSYISKLLDIDRRDAHNYLGDLVMMGVADKVHKGLYELDEDDSGTSE